MDSVEEDHRLADVFESCVRIFNEGDRWKLREPLEELSRRIDLLGVFSLNEELEDLSTESIKFLLVDWYLGAVYEDAPEGRLKALEAAQSHYKRFLHFAVSLYHELAFAETKEILKRISKGNLSLIEQRSLKIDRFKQMRLLEEQTANCSEEEEALRQYWIRMVNLHILRATQSLEQIGDELGLLNPNCKQPTRPVPPPPPPQNHTRVTRPFRLVSKREEIAETVFRPDYNLPTMTIDEYLELERKRGGILDGHSPNPKDNNEQNDDDNEDDEVALQRARQFDQFKDENPRGSGNTYNRS